MLDRGGCSGGVGGGRGADESFSAVFGPRDWGTSGFGGELSTPAAHTGPL